MKLEFDQVLAMVTSTVETALANWKSSDDELAHIRQDEAAYFALAWIAEKSACPASKELAVQAVRAFQAEGSRWYA